ncbi:type II secretion system F family protein [Pararhodobacter aggregans]|uniref:Pilus assembly protein TadC n=1 Tax=Pararhodobacter aggregans TaxID=404875 RepID=A0A2T7UJW9_9RHOB|nr:type II secretion system F family protein [Pararhodobacter aggregans]PTW98941.1 tight adherence protein C [Pararhodobacter aggregans]PVE44970.1 pilus assembly protein TadC [Pararhodobacter aggregans]
MNTDILASLTSLPVLIALSVAGGVTLVLLMLMGRGNEKPDPLARLREQARRGPGEDRTRLSRRATSDDTALEKKLEKFKSFLEPTDQTQMGDAKLKMIQAGYHGKNAVRDFHAAKLILAMGGLLIGLAYVLVVQPGGEGSSVLATAMPVLVPTLLGYYFPIYWVNKRHAERQSQITRGFPDALDMLLICTEAGQSMDQSINRVAKELKPGYPALAEEFETVSHQTKAGMDRLEVLREMGVRCGNNDIKSFVTVLVQSATYGTSVAEALRVYAGEMRDKRVMLAEEKANVLPTKLTLGTMLFTVPPLLIILIGPSVYGVIEMLSTADFNL